MLQQHNNYFVQKRNVANTIGLSDEQQMTAALRMFAYGISADSINKYVRIGESTTIKCVKRFYHGVVEFLGLNISDRQTRLTSLGCYVKLINVAFLECWGVWTVCIRCGKTVQQHITECILVMSTD